MHFKFVQYTCIDFTSKIVGGPYSKPCVTAFAPQVFTED